MQGVIYVSKIPHRNNMLGTYKSITFMAKVFLPFCPQILSKTRICLDVSLAKTLFFPHCLGVLKRLLVNILLPFLKCHVGHTEFRSLLEIHFCFSHCPNSRQIRSVFVVYQRAEIC